MFMKIYVWLFFWLLKITKLVLFENLEYNYLIVKNSFNVYIKNEFN